MPSHTEANPMPKPPGRSDAPDKRQDDPALSLLRIFLPVLIPAVGAFALVAISASFAGQTGCAGYTPEVLAPADSTYSLMEGAVVSSPFVAFLLGSFMTRRLVLTLVQSIVVPVPTIVAVLWGLSASGQQIVWACGG